jgi:hypothetical protein
LHIFDYIQKLVTLIGAVTAAFASLINFWWTHRTKVDRLAVTFGSIRPPLDPGYSLHVVSQSDHQMVLRDYGFIMPSGPPGGRLLSLPQFHIDDDDPDDRPTVGHGNAAFEKRGDWFEPGSVQLRDEPIGAYTVTAGKGAMRSCDYPCADGGRMGHQDVGPISGTFGQFEQSRVFSHDDSMSCIAPRMHPVLRQLKGKGVC